MIDKLDKHKEMDVELVNRLVPQLVITPKPPPPPASLKEAQPRHIKPAEEKKNKKKTKKTSTQSAKDKKSSKAKVKTKTKTKSKSKKKEKASDETTSDDASVDNEEGEADVAEVAHEADESIVHAAKTIASMSVVTISPSKSPAAAESTSESNSKHSNVESTIETSSSSTNPTQKKRSSDNLKLTSPRKTSDVIPTTPEVAQKVTTKRKDLLEEQKVTSADTVATTNNKKRRVIFNVDDVNVVKESKDETKIANLLLSQQSMINNNNTYRSERTEFSERNERSERSERINIIPLEDKRLLPQDLICTICNEILYWQPVQTPCHHMFCKSCLMIVGADDHTITKCPTCLQTITVSQLTLIKDHNRIVQRMIDNIHVKCSHYPQCEWTGLLQSLAPHFSTMCAIEKTKCNQCEEFIQRGQIQDHMQTKCLSRPASCEYCKISIPYNRMTMHHDTTCESKPVQCLVLRTHIQTFEEVKGCNAVLERRHLRDHQRHFCPKTPVVCEYGCYDPSSISHLSLSSSLSTMFSSPRVLTMLREDISVHNEKHLVQHCEIVVKRVAHLEQTMEQRIIDEVKCKVDILQETMIGIFEARVLSTLRSVSTPLSSSSPSSSPSSSQSSPLPPLPPLPNAETIIPAESKQPSMIIFGGQNGTYHALKCVYGLFGSGWKKMNDLPHSRSNPSSCRIGEYIYVIGGKRKQKFYVNIFAFHIPTWTWSIKASMKHKLCDRSSVSCNGKIYVLGGIDISSSKIIEMYDPALNRWTHGPSMMRKRSLFASVSIGTHVYVFGGDNNNEASAEVLNTVTRKWEMIAQPLSARNGHVSVSPNSDTIWILGGRERSDGKLGQRLDSVEEYKLSTNTWSILPWTLPKCLSSFSACYHPLQKCLVVAGGLPNETDDDDVQQQSYMRNDATGKWTRLSSLPEPLFASAFISLP
jgi:N-acetylneuraminic acid mutarotase